jgi:hypothetical protein
MQELGPRVERVIVVVSGGLYTEALNAGDLMSERDAYDPKTFYARFKRAELVITEEWAQRLPGVAVHAMHPGWADRAGIQQAMPAFRRLTRPILRDTPRARTRSSGSGRRRRRCEARAGSG